jgi:dolichol-phosphate mannosyltransferase
VLICIGVLGEYVGRVYEQVKERPIYVVVSDTNTAPEHEAMAIHRGELERLNQEIR